MDKKKDDVYYLARMLKDIRFIMEKTTGVTQRELEENELLCDSVLFRLIQISENSGKLTQGFKEDHREIPWVAIRGMRNKIVHDYGDVDLHVVHQTISNDIPYLCEKLEALL